MGNNGRRSGEAAAAESLSIIPEMLHSVCILLLVAVLLRQGARLDVLDADFQAYTKEGSLKTSHKQPLSHVL